MKCFLILLALSLSVTTACRPSAAPVAVSDQPVSINDRPMTNLPAGPAKPLTDMSWTNADDRVQKLGDLRGKAVILDFWATDCPPCREEIPHLNALLARHGAENLSIVGLHVGDEEDRAKIPEFTAVTKLDYGIAFPENDLTRYIFTERSDIPQTAVFDRQGRLVKKIVGFSPRIAQELDAAVAEALASRS